ncbi:phosphohistidine phosphatase SixA [Shewanella sp. OMA3-2]|uniref:phosphohistidine phosphatase SixA n=1 Tax=Shewanella sp. OMA3-2 TaxID=2908650 RepID=UPI001F36C790|nr:phosphohistidine phosphatase SixA [Shewanella sp. OMA3-2]UJF23192.1 phosphohistidine phosphatase SixA [Shewanella sp. OMA3-2]
MQLFLMRHGEASFDAPSDRERMLTHHGRYQTGQMANLLNNRMSQLDLVLVSPYLRAQQTWQVVSKHLPKARKCVVVDDITPSGDPKMAAEVILAYAQQYKADTVLVITHMPIVSFLVSELVAGVEPPIFATSAFVQIDKHSEQASFVAMNYPSAV